MASIPVQSPSLAGLTPAFVQAANTDTVPANGKVCLWVKNGSGAPITVTIITTAVYSGLAVADVAVVVAAGAEKIIGPFARSLFANAQGEADIDYSATTTVTRAALQV